MLYRKPLRHHGLDIRRNRLDFPVGGEDRAPPGLGLGDGVEAGPHPVVEGLVHPLIAVFVTRPGGGAGTPGFRGAASIGSHEDDRNQAAYDGANR